MDTATRGSVKDTHEVLNQAFALENYNMFGEDAVLRGVVGREGGAWAEEELSSFGARTGSAEVLHLGHLANLNKPVLHTHSIYGRRIDEVEFHPAWHELMALGVGAGIHSLPWTEDRSGVHIVRAAKHYMLTQAEAGVGCPITMTFAAVPALRHQPEVADEWVPRITRAEYDSRFIPSDRKRGCLMGMAMTEKQGGSDVRANTTRAEPVGVGGPGAEYLLTGHKWFCSAPMCDAFLTLAQTDKGLSCFIVPRFTPDGERNRFFIQRLKDKLGNRSNASSEIEYHETWARMVGEEGRGVATIIEMVSHTRLDCVIGSAAVMRAAFSRAAHHATHRSAFGRVLRQQPLMKNVLADLAIEVEAATLLMGRLCRAWEEGGSDPAQRAFARLATAVSKYWTCKRVPGMVFEALECHGGNGYVEDSMMPRLYREAPLSSIWEGSGNVMCLDVLRAVGREPESLQAWFADFEDVRGEESALDALLARIKTGLGDSAEIESRARRIVEDMALALQGALMVRHGDDDSRRAFVEGRLAPGSGMAYGTLSPGSHLERIVNRSAPSLG